jgi:hypothetical protein
MLKDQFLHRVSLGDNKYKTLVEDTREKSVKKRFQFRAERKMYECYIMKRGLKDQ